MRIFFHLLVHMLLLLILFFQILPFKVLILPAQVLILLLLLSLYQTHFLIVLVLQFHLLPLILLIILLKPNTLLADAPTVDCLPSQFHLVPSAALPDQTCASAPKVPPAPIRKLARTSKSPAYLQDYSCASACSPASGGPYDIGHSLTHAHLVPSYQSYVLAISSTPQEPQSFFQAVKDPLWREAMDKEIQALEQNHTWDLTTLPLSKTPIGCK